jgi:hypothetical protein
VLYDPVPGSIDKQISPIAAIEIGISCDQTTPTVLQVTVNKILFIFAVPLVNRFCRMIHPPVFMICGNMMPQGEFLRQILLSSTSLLHAQAWMIL